MFVENTSVVHLHIQAQVVGHQGYIRDTYQKG
jgi:hypothetical protein